MELVKLNPLQALPKGCFSLDGQPPLGFVYFVNSLPLVVLNRDKGRRPCWPFLYVPTTGMDMYFLTPRTLHFG